MKTQRPKSNLAQIVLAICAVLTLVFSFSVFLHNGNSNSLNSSKKIENSSNINTIIIPPTSDLYDHEFYSVRRDILEDTYTMTKDNLNDGRIQNLNCSFSDEISDSLRIVIKFDLVAKNIIEINKLYIFLTKQNGRIIHSTILSDFKIGQNKVVLLETNYPRGTYYIETGYTYVEDKERKYLYKKCKTIIR